MNHHLIFNFCRIVQYLLVFRQIRIRNYVSFNLNIHLIIIRDLEYGWAGRGEYCQEGQVVLPGQEEEAAEYRPILPYFEPLINIWHQI